MLNALAVIGMTVLMLHVTGQPATLPHPATVGRHVVDTRLEMAIPCVRCVLRHLVMATPPSAPGPTSVLPGRARR
ncbi:hypothetical protein KBX50_04845 [Micromonospora sp. C51]|uniref:hypothetical protein n=1 Tax=Micromonospora sp. C51 TaxID=2824879 RepID=UPI001B38C5CF|nr:hypothetical protein [Micromonospora sp. C51]MBQ1047817.1 hypothetical protein [Micromonospora sp. C51]